MGLLTILKKNKEKERELRLLMLGLDNAGKTTVVKKFNGEDIDLISPTLGFNIKTLEYRGFKLNIWDVGGQTSLRSYWRNYFEQTDGLIWVVDSADRARLQDCRAELELLLGQEVCSSRTHGVPACRRYAFRRSTLPIHGALANAALVCAATCWCITARLRQQAGHCRSTKLEGDWRGAGAGQAYWSPLAHRRVQRIHRPWACRGHRLDCEGHRLSRLSL